MALRTRGHGTLLITSVREEKPKSQKGYPNFPRKACGFQDHKANLDAEEKRPSGQNPTALEQEDGCVYTSGLPAPPRPHGGSDFRLG